MGVLETALSIGAMILVGVVLIIILVAGAVSAWESFTERVFCDICGASTRKRLAMRRHRDYARLCEKCAHNLTWMMRREHESAFYKRSEEADARQE